MKWKDVLAQGMQNKQAKQAQHDGKGSRGDQHAAKKVNGAAPGSSKRSGRGAARGG